MLKRVAANRIPAYTVGGLFDVFQAGQPRNLSGLQNAWAGRPVDRPMRPGQRVTSRYQLLVGPWYHNTAGTSFAQADLEQRWFDRWLKGRRTGILATRTPIHLIDPQNRRYEASGYPYGGTRATTYFLGAGGALTAAKPTAADAADTIVFTGASLPCDRSTEQWSLGSGKLILAAFGLNDPCAEHDLAPSSAGPGQLVYTTPPLSGAAILAGPVAATLYATATTKETEWIAKLSDVAPDGTAIDISQGALLGSQRALDRTRTWRTHDGRMLSPVQTLTRADQHPVTPGRPTRYDVAIRPTLATLPAGHRLRLTLLTSQLPHLLPPPQARAQLDGGVYSVLRTASHASTVTVPLASPARFAR